MPKLKNVLAGKKAQMNGAWFEAALHKEAANYGWVTVRIPDGCKQLRANKLIRVATPFDYVFAKKGKVLFVDSKTTSDKNFSKSKVKPHQVDALLDLEKQGFFAGYIVFFQETTNCVFYPASLLKTLLRRDSLSQTEGQVLGTGFKIYLDLITSDVNSNYDTEN